MIDRSFSRPQRPSSFCFVRSSRASFKVAVPSVNIIDFLSFRQIFPTSNIYQSLFFQSLLDVPGFGSSMSCFIFHLLDFRQGALSFENLHSGLLRLNLIQLQFSQLPFKRPFQPDPGLCLLLQSNRSARRPAFRIVRALLVPRELGGRY